jgi:hypothetical protein
VPINALLAVALAAASIQQQAAQPLVPPLAAPALPDPAAALAPGLVLPKGTMVRLMVLKEVNSRDNKPGDRFVLRVDEDVRVGSVTVVPTGAKAWGELVAIERTGAAGKSGKLNARLLYLEAAGRRIDLQGERQSAGNGGTGQAVAGVVAFGLFGLLMKGNNASLKAGEILNGYTLADTPVDAPRP